MTHNHTCITCNDLYKFSRGGHHVAYVMSCESLSVHWCKKLYLPIAVFLLDALDWLQIWSVNTWVHYPFTCSALNMNPFMGVLFGDEVKKQSNHPVHHNELISHTITRNSTYNNDLVLLPWWRAEQLQPQLPLFLPERSLMHWRYSNLSVDTERSVSCDLWDGDAMVSCDS